MASIISGQTILVALGKMSHMHTNVVVVGTKIPLS